MDTQTLVLTLFVLTMFFVGVIFAARFAWKQARNAEDAHKAIAAKADTSWPSLVMKRSAPT